MKKSIFVMSVIGLAIISFSLARGSVSKVNFEPGNDWETFTDITGATDKSWRLKSDPTVTIAVMSHNNSTVLPQLLSGKTDEVISEFTRGRLAVLSLVGIDDWRITSHKEKFEDSSKSLVFSGKYHDSESIPQEFKEAHVWFGTKYVSVQVAYPEASKFAGTSAPSAVIERFLASVDTQEQK